MIRKHIENDIIWMSFFEISHYDFNLGVDPFKLSNLLNDTAKEYTAGNKKWHWLVTIVKIMNKNCPHHFQLYCCTLWMLWILFWCVWWNVVFSVVVFCFVAVLCPMLCFAPQCYYCFFSHSFKAARFLKLLLQKPDHMYNDKMYFKTHVDRCIDLKRRRSGLSDWWL